MSGSLCVARGDKILASHVGDSSTSHSNTLLRDLNRMFDANGVALSDIDLFAVAVGPGSFTGLRIGLATTKALAATLSRPCVSVPTLTAVAGTAGPAENVIALLPAGRGEVFVQLFSVSAEGGIASVDEPAHIAPMKMLERYATFTNSLWVGEGAELHRDVIIDYAGRHALNWSVGPLDRNLARQVVTVGLQSYLEERTLTADSLQAMYVRPSDAELNANVVSH